MCPGQRPPTVGRVMLLEAGLWASLTALAPTCTPCTHAGAPHPGTCLVIYHHDDRKANTSATSANPLHLYRHKDSQPRRGMSTLQTVLCGSAFHCGAD